MICVVVAASCEVDCDVVFGVASALCNFHVDPVCTVVSPELLALCCVGAYLSVAADLEVTAEDGVSTGLYALTGLCLWTVCGVTAGLGSAAGEDRAAGEGLESAVCAMSACCAWSGCCASAYLGVASGVDGPGTVTD